MAAQDRKHPTHVLGFASNMHELMAAADLVITKPGGLTTSEALALGKPLFILNPIPGQEAANSDFLLERGAAAKVNRVEDLPYRLGQLLGSKKLAQMAKAARMLGRPDAARKVCEEVVRRVGSQ
jgi:processive 1,2-diacylglycerol beta-glucosyltransferase